MEDDHLDINQIFSNSFSNLINQIVPIIANTVIYFGACFLLLCTILGTLLIPAVSAGYIKSMIDISRGESIKTGQFLGSQFGKWSTFLGASILYYLGILLGFICLILPGIYLIIRWSFVPYLIIDQNKNIFDAFSGSAIIVSRQFWDVCVLCIIIIIIGGIASIMPFLVLLTTPFNSLVFASYYVKLFPSQAH